MDIESIIDKLTINLFGESLLAGVGLVLYANIRDGKVEPADLPVALFSAVTVYMTAEMMHKQNETYELLIKGTAAEGYEGNKVDSLLGAILGLKAEVLRSSPIASQLI
jgi:hypothetical protein